MVGVDRAYLLLLSTHVDRQGVDISFTVCNYVLSFARLWISPPASGVKFCTAVHRRPFVQDRESSHFCELCSPRSPESAGESASARTEV